MSAALAKRGAMLLAAAAFGWLAAEAVLRLFYPLRNTLYQLDERVLHRLIPGARKLFVHHPLNGGARIMVRVNSSGFRGDELRQDDKAARVVVYGDSCIMGEFSPLEETFAEQLEKALAGRSGQPVEVINAGVAAYGPDQEILRMEDELPRLHPRLVVLALFADNDLGDLLRNKLFRLGPDGTLQRNAFELAPALRAEFRRARRPLLVKMIGKQLDRILNRTPAPEQTPEAYLRDREAEYRDFVMDRNNVVHQLLNDFYDADVSLRPGSVSAEYKLALLEALLKHAAEMTRQAGVPLAVLIIPSPIDVCNDFEIQVDPARHPGYRRENISSGMAHAAEAAGLPYLNLFPIFRARQPDTLYFRHGDDHWNAAGQQLAAREMADLVFAQRLWPEAP